MDQTYTSKCVSNYSDNWLICLNVSLQMKMFYFDHLCSLRFQTFLLIFLLSFVYVLLLVLVSVFIGLRVWKYELIDWLYYGLVEHQVML